MFATALVAILVLLAMAAFFAACETAYIAVSRGKMFQLGKDGSQSAARVNQLTAKRERLIGALLLCNSFVTLLAACLATWFLTERYGGSAVIIATLGMTVLVVLFSQLLPKTLAITRTDQLALALVRPVDILVGIIAPLSSAGQFIVWRLLGLFGIGKSDAAPFMAVHEEIRGTVDLHHAEGSMEREHRDMIGGVLDLKELMVADIMTHRKNMISLDAALPPRALFNAVLEARHLRVPVWVDQPENIIGILNLRDVVRAFSDRQGQIDEFDFLTLAAPVWYVPDTTGLEEQLKAFRERRSHFALVVDEYGALQGLVTFEDIVDEIFGDIPDRDSEQEPSGIRPQPDGAYNIDGSMPIRDVNRALDWDLPDTEATTMAGLVIHEARAIPETGQRFAFYGYKFEILRRQRNQIMAIRVSHETGL